MSEFNNEDFETESGYGGLGCAFLIGFMWASLFVFVIIMACIS